MDPGRDGAYREKTVIYTNNQERVTIYKVVEHTGELKCVKEQRFESEEERRMVVERHELQKRLEHPNICQIYSLETSTSDGDFVLSATLEWCSEDLDQATKSLIKDKRSWIENDCWYVLWSVVAALSHAQKANVCHRDLKPSNIFKTDKGECKVGDFGCAKEIESGMMKHTMAGTPLFLSPVLRKAYMQQLMGDDIEYAAYDPYRSDVYSLGLTLVYLLKPSILPSLGNYPELVKTVTSLEITELLKGIINGMLEQEEGQRVDFITLERHLHAIYYPEPAVEVPPQSQTEIPETKPMLTAPSIKRRIKIIKKTTETSSINPSPQHTAETPSITPSPPPPRQCRKCDRSFVIDSSESWRMDYYGSTKQAAIEEYCSKDCFEVKPVIELEQKEETPQREFDRKGRTFDREGRTFDREGRTFDREGRTFDGEERFDLVPSGEDFGYEDEFLQEGGLAHFPGGMLMGALASMFGLSGSGFPASGDSSHKRRLLVVMNKTAEPLQPRFFHCMLHKEAMLDEGYITTHTAPTLLAPCKVCPLGDRSAVEVPILSGEIVRNSLYPGLNFYKMRRQGMRGRIVEFWMPVSINLVENLNRGTCHLCSEILQRDSWVSFRHTDNNEVVCSYRCLRQAVNQRSCPKCCTPISSSCKELTDYQEEFATESLTILGEDECWICMYRKRDVYLPCGHDFCVQCFALIPKTDLDEFGCLYCGQIYPKSEYLGVLPQ